MTDSPGENKPKPPGIEQEKEPTGEFMGRLKKLKKKPATVKAAEKSAAEKQIDEALGRSAIKVEKDLLRKKRIKMGSWGAGALALCYVVFLLFKPFEGGMPFGICKVFLEQRVRYPHELRLSTVEEFETSVRIWYTQVDAFGEYRMEPIQCYFKQDETFGFVLDKVTVNRRELDQKIIDDFNRAFGAVLAVPIDLTLPTPLPDSLADLQFQFEKFIKPILPPGLP